MSTNEAVTWSLEGSFDGVAAGSRHYCALATDGRLQCEGRDAAGETAPPATEYRQVSAGRETTCAVTSRGELRCAGRDTHGQASPPGGIFWKVAASKFRHSCGVAEDRTVVCWGQSGGVPADGSYADIAVGSPESCGVRTDGTLACWSTSACPDVCSPPEGEFRNVTVGDGFACAVGTDGALRCWGSYAGPGGG